MSEATTNGSSNAADVATLVQLLTALTQPDTNTIRQAEAALKPILKQAESMNVLWQLIANVQQTPVPVRHISAVILRKRLPIHYQHFGAEQRLQWQQQVLNAVAQEPERPVRSGLLGVAAALAHVEQEATPPVLQFLEAAANDAAAQARELCFLLLLEMTDTVGLHWKPHVPALTQLFTATLHNAGEQVAVHKAAVQAIGQLMAFWADEPEMEALAPLLPVLLQVASRSAADDDFISAVLDVLYELAYSPAPSLVQYMSICVEFALQCLQSTALELRVRDAAALVIATTAEAKPKAFGRQAPLLAAVLDALYTLVQNSNDSAAGALFESNPTWKADLLEDGATADDDDDDAKGLDNPTETSMAQGTLDMIACEVPKKYVWPACWQRCAERLSNPQDANARKAGIACLGVIAEGCREPLTAALPTVMPAVFAAAQDAAPAVRECACFCLGQVSEHCQPEILQYAPQILPAVFALLDDPNVAVQATSCYVLEMFCERLEPDQVRPVLDSLVRKLAGMLESSPKRSVQEMAVAALAATAVAAEEEFGPYVEGVAGLLSQLLLLKDPNLYSLRGRALECMGHMAIAVGRNVFRPYFAPTMQSAMEGLTASTSTPESSTDLQEFAYAVFANLAKVMKDEFAPALPDLVPHLCQVIDMDEGQIEPAEPEEGALTGLDDSDDEDGDDEGGVGAGYVLHVRTALLEVKKGAITALGEMAAHTGTHFCPHLEACMTVLSKAAANWHPLIKAETADALPSLVIPSIAAHHNGQVIWQKGVISGSVGQLAPHTASLVQAVLTEEVQLLKDEDKTCVGKACEAIQSVLELCGPQCVSQDLLQLSLSGTYDLLAKNAPCQTADAAAEALFVSESGGEANPLLEGADDDDHDAFLQAACDLVGGYCRVFGMQFAPFVAQFFPSLQEFCKPSKPASDRSMAVGCLSEVAQELDGSAIAPHWQTVFLPTVLNGLADEDANVKRNAAFCAGICCESLGASIAADYARILPLLGHNFALQGTDEGTLACLDNSAAAVARMIMACPEHVVPLDQVFGVFLQALPLKVDMTENGTVYQCLTGLIQMQHAVIAPHAAAIVQLLQQEVQNEKLEDETKQLLQQALTTMQQQGQS